MANTNRVNGFRPVKHINGAPYNGQANLYYIPAGEATAVMVGDFVKLSDSDSLDGVPAVERLAASGSVTSGVIVGVVVGFPVAPASGLDTPQYRAASTARYCYVADSPDLVFASQEDGVGGAIAAASVGLNVGLDASAGSTVTGASGMQIDSSTAATTNTLPLRLYSIVQKEDNEVGSAYARWLVTINTHQYANGSTGV